MPSIVSFKDEFGKNQEIELGGLSLYREAMANKVSLRQLVNRKFKTQAGAPDAFMQMCVSAGLRFKKDDNTGIPAANLLDILEPQASGGSFTDTTNISPSRILFPAAILEVIEDALQGKQDQATNVLDSVVGYSQTIATSKFEQPVLSYSGAKGPEASQFSHISQNTRPNLMLSLTASDVTRKVPTSSIGMEISREALAGTTLDLVALSLTRFYRTVNYNEWMTQIGLLLSGDPDATVTSFSAGTSALSSVTAASYDASIVAAGELTQKAWNAYLYNKSLYMTKTHIFCDYATAQAIDNRTNRPTINQNNSMDRIDTAFQVIWPLTQVPVKIIVLPTGTIATNTLLGFDVNSPAIGKVTSSFAEYSAIEEIVMQKSTQLRFDRGWLVWRMWDQAFDVMTLTV